MDDEIRICSSHRTQRATPLIWTFAFSGAEYWCPWCGKNYGMLGAGEEVEATPELLALVEPDKAASKDYLHASSAFACSQLKWEDRWIPPSELPQAEKDRLRAIIAAWVYPCERASASTTNAKEK